MFHILRQICSVGAGFTKLPKAGPEGEAQDVRN